MANPVLVGGASALVILAVVGFARAIAEYGYAGLWAYAKLLLAPAVIFAGYIMWGSPFTGGRFGGLIPASPTLKRLAIIVAVVTIIALAVTGIVGVGWLIEK